MATPGKTNNWQTVGLDMRIHASLVVRWFCDEIFFQNNPEILTCLLAWGCLTSVHKKAVHTAGRVCEGTRTTKMQNWRNVVSRKTTAIRATETKTTTTEKYNVKQPQVQWNCFPDKNMLCRSWPGGLAHIGESRNEITKRKCFSVFLQNALLHVPA